MPCDMSRYPADWPQIRARILDRAQHCCEFCGLPNYAVGYRDDEVGFYRLRGNEVCDAAGRGRHPNGKPLTHGEAKEFADQYNDHGDGKRTFDADGNHWIVVVLTIAHVDDSDPQNCADSNLKALCQRCHNNHDMPMRKANAKQTLMGKKAVGSLFGDAL